MKKTILFICLFAFIQTVSAQYPERIVPRGDKWPDEQYGLSSVRLPKLDKKLNWPAELKGFKNISLYDFPFDLDSASIFGTGYEEIGNVQLSLPKAVKEVFLLLYADFPLEERTGFEQNFMPLDVLDQPERILFELKYNDGSVEKLIPINHEKQVYGITRGRGLYSLKAPAGKSITSVTFHDKMTNASFLIAGASVNFKQTKIADPLIQSIWYPAVKKVANAPVEFGLNKKEGLSWGKLRSAMLPKEIDLSASPIFRIVIDGDEIPSTMWKVIGEQKKGNITTYNLSYIKNDIKLAARLIAERTRTNEIELKLNVTNTSIKEVTGTLFFPVVEGMSIDNVDDTWYAYARDGLVLNKIPCNWRDYLGSEKPMQYDGIFNPAKGVGVAFLPRDTTDVFRWYNLSKNDKGVNYSLEFPPMDVKQGESFKSITWAMAVVAGDWKDQFKLYKNWVKTWYKPFVPRLPWFQKVFAFVVENASTVLDGTKNPDMVAHAKAYKDRWGALDYFHVWGWCYTGTMDSGSWFGDYTNFENVGGKEKLLKTVKTFQDDLKVPFAVYLDAYLISINSTEVSDSLQQVWSIKDPNGIPVKPYASFSACLYVKEWRDYLKNVYIRMEKDFGFKGLYYDETGMNLRTRVCYDKKHGHGVPYYQADAEREILKELKMIMPKVAIYPELGATDVFAQYGDGSFGYTTFWGGIPPRGWGNFDAHPSYNVVAPHYLHLRRFVTPDFKTFELNMFNCPWRNGNWYMLKFPFFNGNSYYHRWDDGVDADQEAVDHFKKIRILQEKYKNEFSSMTVEPMLQTESRDIFVNKFSSEKNDVYTVYNAGFRTQKGQMIILDKIKGATVISEWTNDKITTVDLPNNKVGISFEIDPRGVACFVVKK